ncbi:MAG: hypothetical protein WA964_00595 [Ilumatobacter sp.]|uniref:hypothetical protein n=1 Tax=Ilumatobacter sp. TaxID=1967498 RepID=UPI003C75A812
MTEALSLRNDPAPTGLVVVRLGARTTEDSLLLRSVEQCRDRWGIWGFSVFEVPDGDYDQLARLRPIVAERRQLLVADAAELVDDGFPLLPTLDAPHWTVVLADATSAQFSRVRAHFEGPIDNPSYRARSR